MNAAEYRGVLDQAIAALEAIVRSVIAREGVPVNHDQRVEVATQLLRYVQHARSISHGAAVAYLRTMQGVNFNLPAEPEQYGLGAPIDLLKRVAADQGVTEATRHDGLVARKSARAISRGLAKHAEQPAREVVQKASLSTDGGAWARVLTGANSCYFCAMMASRGPVYETKEQALSGKAKGVSIRDGVEVYVFHDGCDCIVVFVPNARRNRNWEGRAAWKRLEKAWSGCDDDGDLRDDDDDRPTDHVFRSWWERQVREGKTDPYIPDSILPTTVPDPPGRYPEVGGHGGEVPFTPDTAPEVTDEVLGHIAVGEPKAGAANGWTGGHMHGGNGSSKFPESWGRDEIRGAVRRVLAGPPDLTIERLGSTLYFRATIDDVPMVVRTKARPGKPKIWTAYPELE